VSNSPAPAIGIVIVTYNSRPHFARLKAALEAQTDQAFDLIVWDNASAPENRPCPEDFPIGARLVQSGGNLGFAIANNRAVAMLDTPLVALLNPDAFPEPTWLARLRAAASRYPRAGAFGSTQIAAEQTELYDGLGDCYHAAGIPWRGGFGWPRAAASATTGETFSACAAAALYRTSAWRALGGFDERFVSYCEDVDLGFRLRLAGWRVMQIADAVVHHVGGASSGKKSRYAVENGTRNRLWTYVKNMPAPLLWLTLPAHVAMTLAFLAISPFRGTGAGTWAGVGQALGGLGPIIASRADIQATANASWLHIARMLAWSPFAMIKRAPLIRPNPDDRLMPLSPP
jgi:N-acetylglucosaminyl-diphospho-decaprenol L-rhamnosyltransferase